MVFSLYRVFCHTSVISYDICPVHYCIIYFKYIGIITNVTLDIDTETTKVELRWEEPTITNGIITGYKFTVEGQSTLNRDISGGSPKYIKFDALG